MIALQTLAGTSYYMVEKRLKPQSFLLLFPPGTGGGGGVHVQELRQTTGFDKTAIIFKLLTNIQSIYFLDFYMLYH